MKLCGSYCVWPFTCSLLNSTRSHPRKVYPRMATARSLLSPHISVGGDIVTALEGIYMRPFVGGWVSGCTSVSVRPSRFALWAQYKLVFSRPLSNFTLLMTKGGTLLILGHRVKGQGLLWHSVYKTLWTRYRLQFLPNHFQTSHASFGWWEEELYWFLIVESKVKVNFSSVYKTLWARYKLQFLPNHFQTLRASCRWWQEELYWFRLARWKVKVNFSTLCVKPCGHDTDYSFCPITFQLHMHVVDDERTPFDFGSSGQRSTLGLCLWNLVGAIPFSFWVIGSIVVVNFGTLRGGVTLCVV